MGTAYASKSTSTRKRLDMFCKDEQSLRFYVEVGHLFDYAVEFHMQSSQTVKKQGH